MKKRKLLRWALLWRSRNRLDGRTEHLVFRHCLPCLFRTRSDARFYAEERYGFIRKRPDLRAEPHGWRMPKAVRVKIALEAKP